MSVFLDVATSLLFLPQMKRWSWDFSESETPQIELQSGI